MFRHPHLSTGLAVRMLAAMAALAGVYAALGLAVVIAGVPAAAVVATVAAVVLAQWLGTEAMARRMTRARELTPAEDPDLHALLDRLCALTDQPKPRLAISAEPVPNAFTVGRSCRHATVIVSRGLRDRLDRNEMDAVLAHELAHIAHRDVAVMTVASSLAIALAWLSRGILRLLGRLAGNGAALGLGEAAIFVGGALGAAVVGAVSSVLAHLPLRALSRYRELAADRTAAITLGHPAHVGAALVKATGDQAAIPARDLRAAGVPGLGFVGPPSRFGPLFCTHPPLRARLDQLGRLQRDGY